MLGPFETLVLLTILRTGDAAGGSWIRRELQRVTGEAWNLRATHTTLRRLQRKGYVHSGIDARLAYLGMARDRSVGMAALGLRALRRTLDTFEIARRDEHGFDLLVSATTQVGREGAGRRP